MNSASWSNICFQFFGRLPTRPAYIASDSSDVSSSHLLEYSLVITSVVAIGHLSTVALAAATLGMMTASVTGYSIIQGLASTLDTMLPGAWTSPNPRSVGLWSQRMGQCTRIVIFVDEDVDVS
jgi:multidrug resistance protein, MATE family